MGWKIYQAGYDDGRRATGQTVTERKPLIRMPKPEKPIDNNPYYDDILANIEAYDGTEAGQRAVRNKK